MFWRMPSRVGAAKNAKRKLQRSYKTIAYLVSPFALWGVVIILINAVGNAQISNISAPIALFNMINFVIVRTHRVFFFLQVRSSVVMP